MKYTFSITTVGTFDRSIKSNIFFTMPDFLPPMPAFVSRHAQVLAWKARSEDARIFWNISYTEHIGMYVDSGESILQDGPGILIDLNEKVRLDPGLRKGQFEPAYPRK